MNKMYVFEGKSINCGDYTKKQGDKLWSFFNDWAFPMDGELQESFDLKGMIKELNLRVYDNKIYLRIMTE